MVKKQQQEEKIVENNKGRFKKRYSLLTVVIVGLLTLLIGSGTVFFIMDQRLTAAQRTNKSMAKIEAVYSTLYNNYYRHVSRQKLENGALSGMVNALGDPFSEYMSKSETQSLNDTISSSFTGIGAEVRKNGDKIQIVSPIDGTPAAKAGLKANDVIEKINGKSMNGVSLSKAVSYIRGKKGTKVTLTIKRNSETFTKTLVRDTIPVKTVTGKLDKEHPTVGYLRVSTFSEKTAAEFKSEIKQLRKQGAKSFVIDMRDNPGGLMDQALAMSSMFLKDGKTIMQVQSRDQAPQVFKAGKKYDDGFKVNEKSVVLINGGSASAAEIFSGALKQSANIKLIGTKSYGKGTVQNTVPFNDKTELKVTIAKWLTPDGSWIHHKGLQPTVKKDFPSYAYQTAIDTTKTYQQGDVSAQVKKIQVLLNALDYGQIKANGYFDATTQGSLKKFQSDNKLQTTGKADKATIEKLEEKTATKIAASDDAYQTAVQEVK
ncbi:S41 family peptidase [Liquorilactobacillus capillatus]|uniref:Carboxy-terminal processing protease n=1 Tax=Liquorilactobacillus capillatus DSM 19910 TaxID=1423731 RepID=A0A0R1LZW9_9LACO|nr:S41 family peptidase [Liquorilactobacillus capillatus]KRL01212.1 carboxy-terminal processing protease [Liquorilactobacillus capillatus DSM 19910]